MTRPLTRVEIDELRMALVHDLKTPLTVITGYAELLRLRPEDEATREEAPQRILEATRRITAELDALATRFAGAGGARRTPDASDLYSSRPRPVRTGLRRILLADDDDDLRQLLRVTFPEDEFAIVEARTGQEALDVVAREPVDLVVLDWELPVRSGREVLAELREQRDSPHVVVLTAFDAADPVGADAFLLKPFSPVELLDAIERLVSGDRPITDH